MSHPTPRAPQTTGRRTGGESDVANIALWSTPSSPRSRSARARDSVTVTTFSASKSKRSSTPSWYSTECFLLSASYPVT